MILVGVDPKAARKGFHFAALTSLLKFSEGMSGAPLFFAIRTLITTETFATLESLRANPVALDFFMRS